MAPRERPLIAVVNDDTSFLHLMKELLERSEGYQVLTHKSWNAAYEFVKQADPDLVIVDIVMGDEERGWTLISMLTLDPETRPIPIVVCSAAIHSLRAHQPFLDERGIRSLDKPFDLDDLLDAVKELLASHPPRPRAAGG